MNSDFLTGILPIVVVIGAYLLGSISFAVVVSRVMQLPDPYTYGSKNPGATNVLRTGNKKAALYTLLGDSLKGFIAVVLAGKLFSDQGDASWVLPGAMIAVFIGHVLPIFHRFQGGKGVATAAGILIGVNGILGLATMATWLIIAFFFRYSSLAALSAAAFAPFYAVLLFGMQPICGAILFISAVLIWRHRQNIKNLLAGTETKIGSKKK